MASLARKQSHDTNASPTTSPAQYPFPTIDSPRTQSFSRPLVRRGSTVNTALSFTTNNDTRNAIVESSPNAISTLLQPPILRTGLNPHNANTASGFRAPTQRDIPPVALTNIPHVEAKVFHPYLAQVGSLYEALQRAKNETEEGDTSLFHRDKKDKSEDWEAVLSKRLQRPPHSRQGSIASSMGSPTESPRLSRRSSAQRRQAVTPLSTIPSVYSEDDFHLENPRTFDVVSERSEIVRDPNAAPSGRKSLATNAILQEKLSWYMDTVEIHLITSISTASKSFFSALGSLRELHAEAEDSITRIQKLRKELSRLDKEMAFDGLKVVNLKQRRDNVRRLADAILQLEDIVSAVQKCEEMIRKDEIYGAMNDIDSVEGLMAGQQSSERYAPQDLRGLKALDGALEDLNLLRSRVGRGYESRFHGSLLGDIRRHVAETENSATLQRWGTAFSRPKAGQRRALSTLASYMNMVSGFRQELEAEMQGLSRARYTTPAVTTFRALVLKEIKSIIRKHLPSSTDDDSVSVMSASTQGGRKISQQEKSSILARNIRALDNNDWYEMLVKVYTSISESLRRLSVQVKILLDITSTMDHSQSAGPPSQPGVDNTGETTKPSGRPRSVSIQVEMQQALDLSNLLGEAVDAAQNQLLKVLRVRSQQNSEMAMEDFIRYFTLNRLFADECEAISGRSGTGFKAVVDAQIREYIAQFGAQQRSHLVSVMDADKWEAKDFGTDENVTLSRVIDGSTGDAATWVETSMIWQSNTVATGSGDNTINGAEGPKVRSAVIDEQKFILSESPIATLKVLERLEHLATGIPGIGQEVANSLLDCLKLFNSRTSQLILGAGATRSAGLKNITTKHLALSSQGLSFMIVLIPYVREFFRRHVPASAAMQNMTEFDRVKRLLQEHQQGIHEKLVDIMSGRASTHVRTMKTIDWEEAAKNTGVKVSPYMEILTKETATLHKVLAKHLSEGNVMSIMVPVFSSYKKQLATAYQEVELKSAAAKERLLADAQYLNARLSKLEGSGDLGSYIVNMIDAKTIVTPAKSSVNEPATEHTHQGEKSGEAPEDSGVSNEDAVQSDR